MSVRTLMFSLALLAGACVESAQGGQDHGQAHQPAQTPEQMKQHCEMMAQHMEAAHKQMEEMDAQLQTRLTAMREARGEAKVTAMAAVIEMLVEQRHGMHGEHARVMHGMMMHMGEHAAMGMEGKAHEAMMQCPMMQMHGGQHEGDVQPKGKAHEHGQ